MLIENWRPHAHPRRSPAGTRNDLAAGVASDLRSVSVSSNAAENTRSKGDIASEADSQVFDIGANVFGKLPRLDFIESHSW
jgi:hypothetical protein